MHAAWSWKQRNRPDGDTGKRKLFKYEAGPWKSLSERHEENVFTLRPSEMQMSYFFVKFGEFWHSLTCSLINALEWMGAIRMRVQTDKNITIIHKF